MSLSRPIVGGLDLAVVRPSGMGRIVAGRCEGMPRLEVEPVNIDDGGGDFGTRGHGILADTLEAYRQTHDPARLDIHEMKWGRSDTEMAFLVARALAWFSDKGFGRREFEVETRVEIPYLEDPRYLLTAGTGDYAEVLDRRGIVVDWKFYHDPIDEIFAYAQIVTYLAGFLIREDLDEGEGFLYLPLLDREYHVRISRADAYAFVRDTVLGVFEWQPGHGLEVGSWCQWCPKAAGCPAIAREGKALLRRLGGFVDRESRDEMVERFRGRIEALPIPTIAETASLASDLEAASKAAKKVAKVLLERGVTDEELTSRWELREKHGRRRANVLHVWWAFESILSPEEFGEIVRVSWKDLEELVIRKLTLEAWERNRQRITKKAAQELFKKTADAVANRTIGVELRKRKHDSRDRAERAIEREE